MYEYPADYRTAVCIGYGPPMTCPVTEQSHMEHGWLVRMTGEVSVMARILVGWWERRNEITSGADRSGAPGPEAFWFLSMAWHLGKPGIREGSGRVVCNFLIVG